MIRWPCLNCVQVPGQRLLRCNRGRHKGDQHTTRLPDGRELLWTDKRGAFGLPRLGVYWIGGRG